jgi:hypothetical protein
MRLTSEFLFGTDRMSLPPIFKTLLNSDKTSSMLSTYSTTLEHNTPSKLAAATSIDEIEAIVSNVNLSDNGPT